MKMGSLTIALPQYILAGSDAKKCEIPDYGLTEAFKKNYISGLLLTVHVSFVLIFNESISPRFAIYCIMNYHNLKITDVIEIRLGLKKIILRRVIPFLPVHRLRIPF